MQSIVTLYVLFKWGSRGGIEWCSPWSQRAFRDKHDASSLARSRNLVRFKIGWEWFDGKLLLNHFAVCSFIRSRAGACKMIHDVSLFLKPRLQLSGTHSVFCCACMIQPSGRKYCSPTFFSFFYHFFSLFFSVTQCCFIKRATHPGSVLLINIPRGLAVKIINLISLRRELDVSLITARNIKQIKAQSLALHHRKEWRSREFRKLNCWEHSVIYLPHYPGDATFFFFTLFIRKTCLELDVRELLHITVLFDTASLAKKAQQFRGELSSTKLQNVHPCPAGYYF